MKPTTPTQAFASVMRIHIQPNGFALQQSRRAVAIPQLKNQQTRAASTPRPRNSGADTRPKVDDRSRGDPRVRMIRYSLHHPLTPRPLRFSRLRTLRHWTIHRAAQLLLHKDRQTRERELERQYNAMRDAMEELRLGVGDGGRLYRQAVDRKGIYGGLKIGKDYRTAVGNGGVPIEYARAQTEGPPRKGWDEGWTRR